MLDTQAGQPGLILADPAVQHFLLQGTPKARLASLDLATGHVTDLPFGGSASTGAVITW